MTKIFNANPKNLHFLWVFALLLLSAVSSLKAQNCANDNTPPTAVCPDYTVVAIGNDDPNDCYGPVGPNGTPATISSAGITWVKAITFDDGSFDDCNGMRFTIRRMAPYSNPILNLNSTRGILPCDNTFPTFPSEFERAISEQDSIKFYSQEVGTTQTVILEVYQVDSTGQIMTIDNIPFGTPIYSQCLTTVEIVDKIAPTVQAPPNVTVTCNDFDPTFAAYGNPVVNDNACIDTVITTVNYTLYDTVCHKGTITRVFQAFDCSGNSSTLGVVSAMQTIVVTQSTDYYLKFPNDVLTTVESPTGYYGEVNIGHDQCELIGISYSDEVLTNQPDCKYMIRRDWSVINWCTYNPNLPVIAVPNPNPNVIVNHPTNLPGPVVAPFGTPAPWVPTIVKINPDDPSPTDFSTFWNANPNRYQYTQFIKVLDNEAYEFQGKVFADSLVSCAYDAGEQLLSGWTVKATGQSTGLEKRILSDSNGEYSFQFSAPDSVVTITLESTSNFGQGCQTEYSVPGSTNEATAQDIPVHLENECALLSVGVATARLRRCFDNQYSVQACNLSSSTVEDAYVEVMLDEYLSYVSSSVPGSLVSGNTYTFQLGDLPAGDCRLFTITAHLNCDAPIGATHCTEANIYPFDDCGGNLNWSGADVDVSAICDGDSIRFAISNVGTGDMTQLLNFVVVEDVIMRQQGQFQLQQGQSIEFSQLADGNTWRLQAEEEPYHPWRCLQAVALEGCGGFNTPGAVNLFPLSDTNPFEALDCTQNIGSYDPNDKQGFPEGVGAEHFIDANTDIEYLIRFQNTGTDTAFTVVVYDTLSQYLEPTTVRTEASSHNMDVTVLDGGVLRFTFNNILLPDSNTNQAASNGFLKFRVSQKPDLAIGTRIENTAAIYFDFNDAVLTNTTFHTIGDHYLGSTGTAEPGRGLLHSVYPNPVVDLAYFKLDQSVERAKFELINATGAVVASEQFAGAQYVFKRKGLPAGIYQYQFKANNTTIATGKIILK